MSIYILSKEDLVKTLIELKNYTNDEMINIFENSLHNWDDYKKDLFLIEIDFLQIYIGEERNYYTKFC